MANKDYDDWTLDRSYMQRLVFLMKKTEEKIKKNSFKYIRKNVSYETCFMFYEISVGLYKSKESFLFSVKKKKNCEIT